MLHGGEIYDKEVKLDFSVSLNPVPCPREVRLAIRRGLKDSLCYPDQTQRALREAVFASENALLKKGRLASPENIVCGNGSSELLAAVVRHLNPSRVLLPAPCFLGYSHALQMLNHCHTEEWFSDRRRGFRIGAELLPRITRKTELLILTNPNNPTGKTVEEGLLREILLRCRDTQTKLLVDECFLRMSKTAVSLRGEVENYDFLYVLDSYTKLFSIPGVRIGLLFSKRENIAAVKRLLPEWNLSACGIRGGIACAHTLQDGRFLKKTGQLIRKETAFLRHELWALGLSVFSSDTAFLLFYSPVPLYEPLLSRGILIRDCDNFSGLKKGYYRIAAKDHGSNLRLVKALGEVLREYA